MKFTLGWLKDFLDTDASIDDIVEALNRIGLEVEEVIDPASKLGNFITAKVLSAEKHPNADKLKVCMVDTGSGQPVQVVCGAPNARAGMVGVFAPPGTHVPGTGLDLKVAKVRGVESAGMLCSERELEISDDHDGIIDLPADTPIGQPAAAVLGLDDPVIEIAITPNRGDALGVYGIARDLAAAGLGTLKPIEVPTIEGSYDSPISVSIDFDETPPPCRHFIGRHFRGVKNGPAPLWMQHRLRAVGLRPISALVDITNYVMLSYNRPLHVFDAAKVQGDITVRSARSGEKLLALDGKEYELDDGMVVVADAKGPEALGGIIGGEESGCTEDTTEVFLEVAWFDPIRTAETGRKLNVMTDARYRFERTVDPAFLPAGAAIATQMILDICGGECSRLVQAGEEATPPKESRTFFLRAERVQTLGGLKVPLDKQNEILATLGFDTTVSDRGIEAVAPSWRPDIKGEADLVEEIVRIIGLDEIPSTPLPRPHAVARPVLTDLQLKQVRARHALAARGMLEAATYAFLPKRHAELFGGGQKALELANPISTELSDMRPSLLPNLLAAAGRNAARGHGDVCLFEVGSVYHSDAPEGERIMAGGIRQGQTGPRHWDARPRGWDVFDAKADALAVLEAAGFSADSVQVDAEGAPEWYHPGRSAALKLGPKKVLGYFGELHPAVLKEMEVKGPVAAFEIFLDELPARRKKGTARPPLDAPELMPLRRDLAFVVDAQVPAQQIVQAARGAEKKLIADVRVFDVFDGEQAARQLGEGRKSVAIEITLQPRGKTLTDEEIAAVMEKIVAAVARATGAQLRS